MNQALSVLLSRLGMLALLSLPSWFAPLRALAPGGGSPGEGAGLAGVVAARLEDCEALVVEHHSPDESGLYAKTGELINGAPVYSYESITTSGDAGHRFYIYRHRVGWEESGYVWVLQPVPPDPEVWQAEEYGRGDTPWTATWSRALTVTCDQNSRKRGAGEDQVADLVVLYTREALAEANGQKGIESLIKSRVAGLNNVFYKSNLLPQRVRLVYTGLLSYEESSWRNKISLSERRKDPFKLASMLLADFTVPNAGISASNREAVQWTWGLREALGADLVSVFVATEGIPCGIGGDARHPTGNNTFRHLAYSIVAVRCYSTPVLSLAHEIGHNFGLRHDRGTIGKGDDYDPDGYNYGYVDKVNKFFTVMAYIRACGTDCKPIPQWSSPDVFSATAICDSAGRCHHPYVGTENADNRRAMNENFPTIARFYDRPTSFVAHPQHLELFDPPLPVQKLRSIPHLLYNATNEPLTVGYFLVQDGDAGDLLLGHECEGRTLQPWESCLAASALDPVRPTGDSMVRFSLQIFDSRGNVTDYPMSIRWAAE